MTDLWQALLEEDREMRALGWRGCVMWYGVALPLTIPVMLLGACWSVWWSMWFVFDVLYDHWCGVLEPEAM